MVLEPDLTDSLFPGRFGQIRVGSRSELSIESGTYFVDSFDVHPQASVTIVGDEPVFLYVRDELKVMGDIVSDPEQLFIGYFGTASVQLGTAIHATVVAPNAILDLRRPTDNAAHRGAFFAKEVNVFSNTRIEFEPFDYALLCPAGAGSCLVDSQVSPTTFVDGEIVLPKGVELTQIVLAAKAHLEVVGSEISADSGFFLTSAEGSISVGNGGAVPSLAALGGAIVNAGAVVQGDILADAISTIDSGGSVSGEVSSDSGLSPALRIPLQIAFPPVSGKNVVVEAGGKRILLPGDYGKITVTDGGVLYLSAGTYQFREVDFQAGSKVFAATEDGWTKLEISGSAAFNGTITGLGSDRDSILALCGGTGAVSVSGAFNGVLLAPSTKVIVAGGTHQAFFYGNDVDVINGASISPFGGSWTRHLVEAPSEPVFSTFTSDTVGSTLVASTESTGVITRGGPFDFTVPSSLPVEYGNAGNHSATLELTLSGGGIVSCEYKGGSAVPHPTSLAEKAAGKNYNFVSCDDDTPAGATVTVTRVELTVSGDADAENPRTGVRVGLDDSCGGMLPQPIDPALSRQMIENFSWSNATHVPERLPTGEVALYYAYIYFEDQEDVDNAQRLLIHTQSLPLFQGEMAKYAGQCGTIGMEGDGEGIFAFAVLPGLLYNKILDARTHPDIPEEQREVFRAIILREPPNNAGTVGGALKYEALADAGFRYMGLSELPDDAALDELVYGAGVASAIIDALEWIGNAARDVSRELVVFLGTIDKFINGSHSMTIDLDVRNLDDPDFESNGSSRFADDRMIAAWGAPGIREIAPSGSQTTLYAITQHAHTLWQPVLSAYKDRLDANGKAYLEVPNQANGSVEVVGLCFELRNDAARLTSHLLRDESCNFKLGQSDVNDFENESITVKQRLKVESLAQLTEVTDSYKYMKHIVGVTPKQMKVLRGALAYLLSPDGRVWVSCLDYGNLLADQVFESATGLAGPIGLAYQVLAGNDVYFPPKDSNTTRGVISHEYGHYALCALSEETNGKVLAAATKTFDSWTGNLDAGNESRVLNEAFADFFAYQVVGGVSYLKFPDSTGSAINSLPGYFTFNYGPPGLDRNRNYSEWIPLQPTNYPTMTPAAFARLNWAASIWQDLFDGHGKTRGAPTSGDWWDLDASGKLVTSLVADPDQDESVALMGDRLVTFSEKFFDATDASGSYTYEAFEQGVVETMQESGVTWCNQCELMAPNYLTQAALLADGKRGQMHACLSGTLGDLVGPPPMQIEDMNAWTCQPCPPGQGMSENGYCHACGADAFVDWSENTSLQNCDGITILETSAPTDNCPHEFIVDVQNAYSNVGVYDLFSVAVGSSQPIGNAAACESSSLSIDVESGQMNQILTPAGSYSSTGQFCTSGPPVCEQNFTCQYPQISQVATGGTKRVRVSTSYSGDAPSYVYLAGECQID